MDKKVSVRSWTEPTDDFVRLYTECIKKAGVSDHPNYCIDGDDSVLNLLRTDRMFMYTIVMDDNIPVGASGLRLNVNVKGLGVCAQCGVRMMSIDRTGEGLRRYPYVLAHSIPLEVECAQSIGYTRHILTFNDYNQRLSQRLERIMEHPDVPEVMRGFKLLSTQYVVNGVDQSVMVLNT